ncbi:MAG: phosphatase PAP2 family protein [Thermoleophilia bacterium]|nr:phosphatase PAP2 family protein [Thermoleophilia bacterium]
MTGISRRLSSLDRALGAAAREAVARRPAAAGGLAAAAGMLSPGFRVVVALLCARRATRREGAVALAAGVAAALLARAARDRIGRRRPGPRAEGGFPSRHAAAAAAITTAVAGGDRRLGTAMGAAACVGLTGRVTHGHHEPGDIAAGALLGVATGLSARRVARVFPGRRTPG